jgi:hypothetical protein
MPLFISLADSKRRPIPSGYARSQQRVPTTENGLGLPATPKLQISRGQNLIRPKISAAISARHGSTPIAKHQQPKVSLPNAPASRPRARPWHTNRQAHNSRLSKIRQPQKFLPPFLTARVRGRVTTASSFGPFCPRHGLARVAIPVRDRKRDARRRVASAIRSATRAGAPRAAERRLTRSRSSTTPRSRGPLRHTRADPMLLEHSNDTRRVPWRGRPCDG